jgi:hypothetical protein
MRARVEHRGCAEEETDASSPPNDSRGEHDGERPEGDDDDGEADDQIVEPEADVEVAPDCRRRQILGEEATDHEAALAADRSRPVRTVRPVKLVKPVGPACQASQA